jgi:anti-anti-sigma factor
MAVTGTPRGAERPAVDERPSPILNSPVAVPSTGPKEHAVQMPTRQFADTTVVLPSGRIDHLSAPVFEVALAPSLQRAEALVIDLGQVEYISSVGLRVLMIAARTMRERQRKLAVCGLSTVVAEIFAISRFDRILVVCPGLPEALDHCSADARAAWQANPS